MKKLLILTMTCWSFTSFAQVDQYACGEFKMLSSCGMFQVHTPVLVTEDVVYSLDSSCPAERLELCHLRSSIVMLMKSGTKYCIGGKINRAYQSPCADDSILVNRVEEISN